MKAPQEISPFKRQALGTAPRCQPTLRYHHRSTAYYGVFARDIWILKLIRLFNTVLLK